MKLIIFVNGCELEEKLEEINDEKGFHYYDEAEADHANEEAILYFEKNYPEYCDIIEIPDNATDYKIMDFDDYVDVIAVVDGKIKDIYFRRFY